MARIKTISEYRKDLRGRILDVAMQQFIIKGIKAVKMDDIAKSLCISKRTLYEIYKDKEDLLLEGIREKEENHDSKMAIFSERPGITVMDILFEFFRRQVEVSRHISLSFYEDVHKYPAVTEYLSQRHDQRKANSEIFFIRGVEEGYFRSDIDYKVVMEIGDLLRSEVLAKQLYKKYNMMVVLHSFIIPFIRGFCTKKGADKLESILKKLNDIKEE